MKYSVAVLLLVGLISTNQAVQLQNNMVISVNMNELETSQESADKASLESVKAAQKKAAEAKFKAAESQKKIEELKAKKAKTVTASK
jgi:hypothetical protein